MNVLQIKITVGGSDYYMSDQEYTAPDSQNFYFPWIVQAPRLTWASTTGGYIDVKQGSMALISKPNDSDHPFSGSDFQTLITTPQAYDATINYGYNAADLINGSVVLKSISNDVLNFTLYGTEYTDTVLSTTTDTNGATVYNPFGFGSLTYRRPVIQTGATAFANPGLATSGLAIYEDSAAMSISSSTTSTVNVSSYSDGEVSISGTGNDGTSLTQFMTATASALSIANGTPDVTKAGSAGSINVDLFQSTQQTWVKLASDVARYTNHEFYIRENSSGNATLYLIDRANNPASSTRLENHEIISVSFNPGYPVQAVEGTYTVNLPKSTKIESRNMSVRVADTEGLGSLIRVPIFADSEADQAGNATTYLTAIKNIEKKPTAKVTVPDIKTDWVFGDRLKFNWNIGDVTADMIIREMTYDFQNLETTVSGDCTLTRLVHDR